MDKNEWISVDEGLPGEGEYVIGATPLDEGSWIIQSGRFRPMEGLGWCGIIEVGKAWWWISHWMSLPGPPVGR